ncbi:MAG: DUF1844 domain-containing protein [Phycisphaeraceae bacterium]
MADGEEAPKIIIDSDWKAQAQADKQKLAEQAKAKESEKGAGAAGAPGGPEGIPPASFETLLSSIATQALMSLGAFMDRRTGQPIPADLEVAKFHIDLLGVLEEKTKGNLSKEESEILTGTLHELRSHFVQQATGGAGAGGGATGGAGGGIPNANLDGGLGMPPGMGGLGGP